MFGRKKAVRKRVMTLNLLDSEMNELISCRVSDYQLPEKIVLALSEEYFSDPDPCEIHRGAVHNRVMMEIMDFCPPGITRKLSDFPEYARAWFPEKTAFVRIAEEAR